jgi:hypothetical protein
LRILYITAHFVLRPSIYAFHDILAVVSGVSELFEDVAVLEGIYGSGILNRTLWWRLVCLGVPVIVTGIQLMDSFKMWFLSRGEETPDMWEEAIKVENFSFPRFFMLSTFLSGCGIVFTQLVVCAQFPTPSMVVQVITSLLITVLLILAIRVFGGELLFTLTWSEEAEKVESFDFGEYLKESCLDLFGCSRPIGPSAENGENQQNEENETTKENQEYGVFIIDSDSSHTGETYCRRPGNKADL